MRTGGGTVQQALTTEAANIVKQAVNLARQRGHAQVTPLHVASTLLSSSSGLLRAACLQSHSHPFQCKALELCFNVALNRIPTSPSGSILGPYQPPHHHHHHLALSNALVAAFKRAQAHQRRGSVDNQQQHLLAVKIDLEQLIISILDDPSVSRVMREAGFSSTQVKNIVEKAVSLETLTPSRSPNMSKESSNLLTVSHVKKTRPLDEARNQFIDTVMEILMSGKKRSLVLLGECLATSEAFVRRIMDRVEHGEVPQPLSTIQFKSLSLSTFKNLAREEVEQKIGELKCFLKGRDGLIYLGDLKFAAEHSLNCGDLHGSMVHVIVELGRLVSSEVEELSNGGRFWLMGIATHETYMKCKAGKPSLETLWCCHPLLLPIERLELSLSCGSGLASQWKSKRLCVQSCWPLEDGTKNQLADCAHCSNKFNTKGTMNGGGHRSATSSLPSWLQHYKEANKETARTDQDCLQMPDTCKKSKSLCSSVDKFHCYFSEKMLNFSSISPSSSITSYERNYRSLNHGPQGWSVMENTKHSCGKHQLWISESTGDSNEHGEQILPSMHFSNLSSSDSMIMEYTPKFKELNAENLKTLCKALEEQVPWQKDTIPEIASLILQCRSGMLRRKEKLDSGEKEETWLFFQGSDVEGKKKIAREIARLVFGSYSNFISIGVSTLSSTRSESSDDLQTKDSRHEESQSYFERFAEAVEDNPHRVILLEDVEKVDYQCLLNIKTAVGGRRLQGSIAGVVSFSDAIFILSCEKFKSGSRGPCSPQIKQKSDIAEYKEDQHESTVPCAIDLNLCADNQDMSLGHDLGLLELVDRTFFLELPEGV